MASIVASDLRVRRLRDFAALAFVQLAAILLLLFLILGALAPWLVSLHDTPALVLAVIVVLACPLILLQGGYVLWRGWRRLKA